MRVVVVFEHVFLTGTGTGLFLEVGRVAGLYWDLRINLYLVCIYTLGVTNRLQILQKRDVPFLLAQAVRVQHLPDTHLASVRGVQAKGNESQD